MSDTKLSPENTVDEAHSFQEYKAVAEALSPYINAAKLGDGAVARPAFFDHAHVVGSVDGTFYNFDADTFKNSISEVGPAPKVQHHIAWIDISGPAAAARIEFIDWAGHRFTDFFVLYKQEGSWKISGKVYNSHARN
ncbi:nuclear transport factor 2 family protein [uncultured Roseobacter sp.]|uniref:nuclear transport factor 2 family protein n=1 Tax=uncultured Roseobacter sp. TaxID=114847 RepID=UPI0026168974|nr:nuclear transport factor 2 family protein [uncultured Roseobacter sp.]